MYVRKMWKSKAFKTIIASMISILIIIIALLGITFWLLLYLDFKTPDDIDYEDLSMQKEEGFYDKQIPSSLWPYPLIMSPS